MASSTGEVGRRLLRLARPLGGWMALGIFLGFLTVGSGVGLMMTSAWLIARAALHPPVGDLQVAIVGVRFFGIARAALRYLERLVSHDAALRVLAGMRLWFYRRLEPLAPARLWMRPSADLLARLVADVESLESFYVRGLRPPLVAAATVALMGLVLGAVDGRVALAAAALMAGSGVAVPSATAGLRRHLGAQIVLTRSDLRVRVLDQVQGLADLLACGRAAAHQEGLEACGRRLAGLQRRLALVGALHEALMGLAASAAAATALALAIPRVRSGELEAVLVPAAVLGILAAFEAILPLPEAAAQMEETAAAAGRRLASVDAPPPGGAARGGPPAGPLPPPPGPQAQ
ncbi:MAG: thiol reductant ABC exporter subunit CydC, partial [Gemmatimonadota bacterium]